MPKYRFFLLDYCIYNSGVLLLYLCFCARLGNLPCMVIFPVKNIFYSCIFPYLIIVPAPNKIYGQRSTWFAVWWQAVSAARFHFQFFLIQCFDWGFGNCFVPYLTRRHRQKIWKKSVVNFVGLSRRILSDNQHDTPKHSTKNMVWVRWWLVHLSDTLDLSASSSLYF